MIADIASWESCSGSLPLKIHGRNMAASPAAEPTLKMAPGTHGAEQVSVHHVFVLAFRQFDALLPTIETLSADLK